MTLSPNFPKDAKYLLNIFLHFLHLHQNYDIFQKKMSLIADSFPKLFTAKWLVTSMPRTPRVRTLMESQHVKVSKTLLRSSRQKLYQTFLSI